MTFSQPSAGGDQFDAKDHNGRLLIVYPKSFAAETPTAHGISPSADVDIVIVDAVDATGKPLYFQNARLFGNLAKSVSRDLGGAVLGRLGQVPTQRGNPAWVLQSFTEQDQALAGPADAAYKAGQFKQPDNPMQQAPAATPPVQYGAPATAPPQQWQGGVATPSPVTAPVAPAAAQWTPPTAAPAPAPSAPPAQQFPAQATQQQWQAPPAAPAAPPQAPAAPAAAAAGPSAAVDPAVMQKLAAFGINPPPGTPADQIMAVYQSLPQ